MPNIFDEAEKQLSAAPSIAPKPGNIFDVAEAQMKISPTPNARNIFDVAAEQLSAPAAPLATGNMIQRIGGAFVQRAKDLTAEQRLAVSRFGGTPEEQQAALAGMRSRRATAQNFQTGGKISNAIVGAAGMLPDMIEGSAGRIAGTYAGKAAALPLALIPRVGSAMAKAVSPVSSKVGGAVGGALPMYLSGVGQLYTDMADEGVPNDVADRMAKWGAIPYAAIESINVYLPVGKAMKGGTRELQGVIRNATMTAIRKVIAKRGGNEALKRGIAAGLVEVGISTVSEASEEFFQEISNETTKNIAKVLSDMDPAWGEALGKAVKAFTEAIGPTLVLGGLGGVRQGTEEARNATPVLPGATDAAAAGVPAEVVAQGPEAVAAWAEARATQQPSVLPPISTPEEAAAAAPVEPMPTVFPPEPTVEVQPQPAQEVIPDGMQGQAEGQGQVAPTPTAETIEGAGAPTTAAVQPTEAAPPQTTPSADQQVAPGPRVSNVAPVGMDQPTVDAEVADFQSRLSGIAGQESTTVRAVARPATSIHDAADKYAADTGRTIVWVEASDPNFEFNATPGQGKNVIILNANSKTLGRDIIEHEVGHKFARENRAFVRRAVAILKETNAQTWQKFRDRMARDSVYSQQSQDAQDEEFFAHAFGIAMNDKAFLDRLAREDMNAFERIVSIVKDIIDRFRGATDATGTVDAEDARNMLVRKDIEDMEAVYKVMMDVAKATREAAAPSAKVEAKVTAKPAPTTAPARATPAKRRDERVRIIDTIREFNVAKDADQSDALRDLREKLQAMLPGATKAEAAVINRYLKRFVETGSKVGNDEAAQIAYDDGLISAPDGSALADALSMEVESALADARGEGEATQDERQEIDDATQGIAAAVARKEAVTPAMLKGSTPAVTKAVRAFYDTVRDEQGASEQRPWVSEGKSGTTEFYKDAKGWHYREDGGKWTELDLTRKRGEKLAAAFDAFATQEPKSQQDLPFSKTADRVTPEQDREYMAAVERGDMAAAQKIVDDTLPPLPKMSDGLSSELKSRIESKNEAEEVSTKWQVLREVMEDSDDKDLAAYDFRNELRKIGIALGVFKSTTQDELDRTTVSGGRKYDFALNGKFYVFDSWNPFPSISDTYDDAGRVIPLSERFNPATPDIRFSAPRSPSDMLDEARAEDADAPATGYRERSVTQRVARNLAAQNFTVDFDPTVYKEKSNLATEAEGNDYISKEYDNDIQKAYYGTVNASERKVEPRIQQYIKLKYHLRLVVAREQARKEGRKDDEAALGEEAFNVMEEMSEKATAMGQAIQLLHYGYMRQMEAGTMGGNYHFAIHSFKKVNERAAPEMVGMQDIAEKAKANEAPAAIEAGPKDDATAGEKALAAEELAALKARIVAERTLKEQAQGEYARLKKTIDTEARSTRPNKVALDRLAATVGEGNQSVLDAAFGKPSASIALSAPQTTATISESLGAELFKYIHKIARGEMAKPNSARLNDAQAREKFIGALRKAYGDRVDAFPLAEFFDTSYTRAKAEIVVASRTTRTATAKAASGEAQLPVQGASGADAALAEMRAKERAVPGMPAQPDYLKALADLKAKVDTTLETKDEAKYLAKLTKELRTKIADMIRNPDAQNRSLVDRMIAELGLPHATAARLAIKTQVAMREIMQKYGERKLKALIDQGKAPDTQRTRSAMRDMLDFAAYGINQGNEDWKVKARDAFAKKYGLVRMTPEIMAKLDEYSKAVREAKNATERRAALDESVKYVARKIGYSRAALGMSVVYANLLSGLRTQLIVNNVANFAKGTSEFVVELEKAGINALIKRDFGYMKDVINAYIRTFLPGMYSAGGQVRQVLATGIRPEQAGKYSMSPGDISAMELTDPKSKIGKAAKLYFTLPVRDLAAQDIIFRTRAYEAKRYLETARVAREQGLRGTELNNAVALAMGYAVDDAALAKYRAQAKAEGYRDGGYGKMLRVWDLLEEARENRKLAPWLTEESRQHVKDVADRFAAENVFSQENEGMFGILANKMGQLANDDPLFKPLFMFTKIAGNVTNEYLDWTLVGFLRAASGRMRQSGGRPARIMTSDERQSHFIRAMDGVAISLYFLTLALRDLKEWQEAPDEEKDKKQPRFMLTATGPSNHADRKRMKDAGMLHEWSITYVRENGKAVHVSFANLPWGGMLAGLGRIMDYARFETDKPAAELAKLEADTLAEATLYYTRGIAAYVLQTSVLSYPSSAMRFASDSSEEQAKRSMQYVLSGFTKWGTGNLFPQLMQMADRKKWRADDFGGMVYRNMGIGRWTLHADLNALGEEIPTSPFGFVDTDDNVSPLWKFMYARGIKLPATRPELLDLDPKTGKMVLTPLTEPEKYEFTKVYGEQLRKMLTANFDSLTKGSTESAQERILGTHGYHRIAYNIAKQNIKQARQARRTLTSSKPAAQ